MREKRCAVIVASRPVSAGMLEFVPPGALVVAADAGWLNAEKLGLGLDLAVGDFDSSDPPRHAAELLRLPREKDETDTQFAARTLIERGVERIVLLGALGGRLDHHQANLQTMLYTARRGVDCVAVCEGLRVHCLGPGSLWLENDGARWVSVFAAGGPAKGVCLRGLKYPLEEAVLTPEMPLGVSNEFAAPRAEVVCREGWLYVMVVDDEDKL